MIDQRDVAALLADPARAVDVPVGDVRALLDAASAQAARLDVVKSILAARLAFEPIPHCDRRNRSFGENFRHVGNYEKRHVSFSKRSGGCC